jgi:hypothetical protein
VDTAVYKLLMMDKRMPETCWAVFKRRAINLRDWLIWLVDLFECMMMHGLTIPKPITCPAVIVHYFVLKITTILHYIPFAPLVWFSVYVSKTH